MVLGIISIVLGAIIFFLNLIKGTETVQQQIVQYLGFVCASIFIVGGFIMITIKKKSDISSINSTMQNDREIFWNCPKCGEKNPNSTYKCGKCNYSLN